MTTSEPEKPGEEPSKRPPPKDDEGLLLSYDVILCGTGLVQSILASALTRAGKTVLHADGSDQYGELDTVWTLEYLQELFNNKKVENVVASNPEDAIPLAPSNQSLQFHSMGRTTNFSVTEVGTRVKTAYGEGTVAEKILPTVQKPEGSLKISLSNWTMADGTSPTVSLGVTLEDLKSPNEQQDMEDYFQASDQIQSLASLAAQRVLESRSLALDVSPALLYASGVGVQGMLTSNVAEHLEFQTMQGMYWLGNADQKLERVPCSKGDVMQSPLLPPLDKRRFMKFLQSAMDYATERELVKEETTAAEDATEEGVLSLNERQLNQGRSLARPQNKARSKKELDVLYECMDDNLPFEAYLEQHAKLSPSLRQLIRHALALEITTTSGGGDENTPTGLSTADGMGRLCDHLKALGRYGTTAFLTPVYGSGELSQFFCRSAAVYGATYLLRRNPKQVTVDDDGRVKGVTISASDDGFGPSVPEKHVCANHVVVAQDALCATKPAQRLLRRISVLQGTLIPESPRSVLVVPPSADHHYAIHGLVLDETAKVAPRGCSVLHLTTVVEAEGVETNDILEKALQKVLGSAPNQQVDEIFHATFSYGLDSASETDTTPEGLHVVRRTAMPLVVDEAFEQAKKIFTTICGPELEFLALSDQMQAKLKEQLQDAYRGPNKSEDDTEQVVLDSAMEMLETKV